MMYVVQKGRGCGAFRRDGHGPETRNFKHQASPRAAQPAGRQGL